MADLMRRLETDERWRSTEIAVRGVGLALLSLCALAVLWLYHSMQEAPRHQPTAVELVDAAGGFVCWSLGGALATIAPALLRRVDGPARFARFSSPQGADQ